MQRPEAGACATTRVSGENGRARGWGWPRVPTGRRLDQTVPGPAAVRELNGTYCSRFGRSCSLGSDSAEFLGTGAGWWDVPKAPGRGRRPAEATPPRSRGARPTRAFPTPSRLLPAPARGWGSLGVGEQPEDLGRKGFRPSLLEPPSLSLALGGVRHTGRIWAGGGGWFCFQSRGPGVWQVAGRAELAPSGLPEALSRTNFLPLNKENLQG